MRNPNGYGTIKLMSGNRRRPYGFLVSIDGKQRLIESFETAAEAKIYQANYYLEHHKKSLPGRKITFEELFYRWLPAHLQEHPSLAKTTIYSYKNSFRHCEILHHKPFADIKYADYQDIIDRIRYKQKLSYSSCKKVRSLISLMSKYAQKMEYHKTNYAELIGIGQNKPVRPHKTISRQKINRLWRIADASGIDTILILLYTGVRIGELLELEKKNVNMKQRFIRIAKSKTEAGLRIIPIHPLILPFIATRMVAAGTYLICDNAGHPYDYSRYRSDIWDKVMNKINGSHYTPHDTRHTVATLLDDAGANENAKRRILGHAGGDVTDRVYTHKSLHQLRKCIQLLR